MLIVIKNIGRMDLQGEQKDIQHPKFQTANLHELTSSLL